MKSRYWLSALVPVVAAAASPFDGTWKSDPKSMQVSGKPNVYLLDHGEYVCSSCSPELRVKADGEEHKVNGHAYYDAVIIKVTGPRSMETVLKKGGKVFSTQTSIVSDDGKTMTSKFETRNGTEPVRGEEIEQRVAAGPAGSHPVSGQWQQQALSGNDVMWVSSLHVTANGVQMHWNGQSYDARFDGKEYPQLGDVGHTTVSLRRLDERTIEETDHRQGKVTDVIRMHISADGNSMSVDDDDVAHGQKTTVVMIKQP